MKRIALLVCGVLLLVANTAEARRSRTNGGNYSQPVQYAPAAPSAIPVKSVKVAPVSASTSPAKPKVVTAATSATTDKPAKAVYTGFSTATAQGIANIMAARGVVGHFGGNPGYEGCGMGGSPAAAYSICCYGNSGMATVDVGYAQGANGMWYCCRRYR